MHFHFDLTDLRLFLNTTDTGSITAGAARTHLSLASASARLRGLEASLGAALLTRGRRGVQPTAAGQALAWHARSLLQQVGRMQEDLGDYASGFKGRIRLLCNTAALTEHLPEPLGAFLRTHPNIDVDLQEQPSHRIVPELREGTADVGIVSDAMDLAGLYTTEFRRDRLVLLAPRGHALARRARVRYSESLDYDHVGLPVSAALGIYLDDQAARLGRRPRTRVRAQNFDAVARMVIQGAGLGIMPEAAARRWAGQGGARVLILDESWADRRLMLCARAWDGLPNYARALIQALMPAAGEAI
ncbi:LysR family transcriptional regulator [Bordetella genomosp. 9]|uniref:LysR family transcriptional regulator n=1 Tax=Bordetella genomosp. 9 TaxID=1416803 RepID=A0A1W6Z0D8_9BORD|nr:LysR family transcriptional regulator [Bordetella genomosp. 9]ARP86822.1 LysR family transcriptional regulator [Bordetella genomosp. 9]ARP90808.1 LysR family transcriptional regulator [Bordetella genomosp. 9]